jgi:type VI secretion system protein
MPLILTLTPIRGSGAPETRTLAEGSLSLGRGPGNDWVLPDPERQLSKTHCMITAEGSRYALTDLSTNGVFMNGSSEPTRRDGRVLLNDGDRFRLGDYEVRVREADIAPLRQASPMPPPAAARREDPFAAGASPDPFGDPLGDDPFGEPHTILRHPVAPSVPFARAADPFDRADEQHGRLPDPDDDLFRGLTPRETWQGPSQADNADAPKQAFLPPKPLPQPSLNDIDFDALLGDEPIGGFHQPTPAPAPPPTPVAPPRAAMPAQPPPDDETMRPQAPQPPAAAPPHVAQTPADAPPNANPAELAGLLAAFLQGAGVPDLKFGQQDPQESLRAAGQVFRALVEGLREVLMSRAAIKNELRVEQTMLRSRDNNALKFSVTPEEAVAALLLPNRAGYKPPLDAAREAFRDIQSHELAVMAGVQTALVGLLKRFDPASLEARLQPGRLDGILPAARKARTWELFCATYKDIAAEAEDDFQSVFGREFAKAYDAQMRKL